MPALLETAQETTIVAADFDHQRSTRQLRPSHHIVRILLKVFDEPCRAPAEVAVLAEQDSRIDNIQDLNVAAVATLVHVQWKAFLCLGEQFPWDVSVGD